MDNRYRSFLFNGEIRDVEPKNLEVSLDFLKHPDLIFAKLTELNNRLKDSSELLFKRMERLEQEIVEWSSTEYSLRDLLSNLENKINDAKCRRK